MWTYTQPDELYHYGVVGMKWGVRRYQNKDGTLTAAGKKHYGTDPKDLSDDELRAKVNRMSLEKRYRTAVRNSEKNNTDTIDKMAKLSKQGNELAKKKGAKPSYTNVAGNSIEALTKGASVAYKVADASRDESIRKIDLSKMSDADLSKLSSRLELETRYRDLENEKILFGRERVNRIIDISGDVLGTAVAVASLAASVKILMKH